MRLNLSIMSRTSVFFGFPSSPYSCRRHTHMPSSSSHQLSPAPAAVTAASKLQQHGWQQCSSGHCGGMSVDIQHFTASASEAQGNCVASPNSETFAGVRVRCPRFEACAAFRLKGLKSGPTIPVGFIQVSVLEKTMQCSVWIGETLFPLK